MFDKIMNRYYYGKSGKGDYTKEDLPQTRWQLFWEMLRIRFSALIRLNLMYVVAWIPAIIVIGWTVLMALGGLNNLMSAQEQAAAGEITMEALNQMSEEYLEAMKGLILQALILFIPVFAITGPATAGLCYVTRNWSRDEHAFIWADFRDAIKTNWKQALLTSLITGVMPLILYVCFNFYGEMARQSSGWFVIPQVLCVMIVLIWMCALMYIYPQMVTYDLSYKNLIRNSLIMTIGRPPMTVGLKLLSVVPAVLMALVSFFTPYMVYALLIYAVYYIVIGFSLSRFVGASYSNAVFDQYLNPKIEGAQVGRGLYVEDDEEEEEEQTGE